jgi:hypothetical protein
LFIIAMLAKALRDNLVSHLSKLDLLREPLVRRKKNCRSLHGRPGQVGYARDDKERVVAV